MNDPYFIGAVINFSWRNPTDFDVMDTYCNLQQLYRIRDHFKTIKSSTKIEIISKYFFRCTLDHPLDTTSWKTYSPKQKELFLQGFIDTNAEIKMNNFESLVLNICSINTEFLNELQEYIGIPSSLHEECLSYYSTNVVDLMGLVPQSYKHSTLNLLIQGTSLLPKCKVYKRDPRAIIPTKSRLSDVGYDVSVIRKHKTLNQHTTLYDTGIALEIPLRYYVEIVPRSSLSKTGYILSNSIGIIDASYRGNLYIALTRISPDAINLDEQLPFRCCQIIFKKQEFIQLEEQDDESEFKMTTRDKGGFGSTG